MTGPSDGGEIVKDRRMFDETLALRVLASGKTAYRPSNGTEGDAFQARWCGDCVKDIPDLGMYCPIIASVMCIDVDDPDYPPEWTYDEYGQPCCTVFDDGRPEDYKTEVRT